MPTKRTHIGRNPHTRPLTDQEQAWLLDEPSDYADTLQSSQRLEEELWRDNATWATETFAAKHPGRRPSAWWAYSAPRWSDDGAEGWSYHGTLPEPRQRLGGTGTPDYECLNVVPHFCLGLPTGWASVWEVSYYNGRSLNIHGEPIGTNFKDGDFAGRAIDVNDPPRFESQASYLKRHGLLLPGEAKRLKAADFEPELVLPSDEELAEPPPRTRPRGV
jgi:hypothetical protein